MNELWKDIKGYEGYYQISNLGRVKSLNRTIIRRDNKIYHQKEQIITPCINHKGYYCCILRKEFKGYPKRVHRLVAENFLDNPNNLLQVNHIDGNKQNNNVNNLEWISNYDNMQHSIKMGLRDVIKITNKLRETNRREILQYDLDGNFIKQYNSIKEAETELHIPNQNIVKVCQGKRKMAHNFVFKYAKK